MSSRRANTLIGRQLRMELLEPRHVLSATFITLNPVADTYTRSGVNAGTATTLETRDLNGVGGDYMAYIRFDLSSVDLTGITNAYFNLSMVSGATMISGRFDVFGLNNVAGNTPQNWGETTLANAGLGAEYTNTAGNYVDVTRVFNLSSEGSAGGANVIEQVSSSGPTQTLQGVDLVNFLKARKADGGLATFIVLVDAGQNRNFNYASRENASAALRPVLKLEYLPPAPAVPVEFPQQVDHLDRGLVVMRRATSEAYVGWRMLGADPTNVGFNVYRSANGGAAVKINSTPITTSTNFVDNAASGFNNAVTNVYTVRPIIGGVERPVTESFPLAANAPIRQYLNIPLQIPPGGQVPDSANPGQFVNYAYIADDGSAADRDGQYEIILKWLPENAAATAYTGPVILDAYRLNGARLWRINLGVNIPSDSSSSPFMAYDLDGDGFSELVSRTAPGTVDGLGANVILPGDNPSADYRDASGLVKTGPEYITVFNGVTGAAMKTVPFLPDRQTVSTWGDDNAHRSESIKMAIAYVDGYRPSLIVGRGIYGPSDSSYSARNELTAWNWRDGDLTLQWWFKAGIGINGDINSNYIGEGSHPIDVADVDGDGRDEIIYGAMVVDDDGTGLYATGRGHGDALYVTDIDLSNPGLEIFMPHESTSIGNHTAATLIDGATGRLLAATYVTPADVAADSFPDVGRGVALDIDPNHPGYEFWESYSPGIYDSHGVQIYAKASNMHQNFGVWWDADLLRETLDNTTVSDWNYTTAGRSNILSFGASGINSTAGLTSNNGTKALPVLTGDLLGDWREEIIWRTDDNTALQIFSTTITSTNKLYTLTHDVQYREAIAWQNVAYNQPPNPSYFLGFGMAAQTPPLVYSIEAGGNFPGDFNGDLAVDADDLPIWKAFVGQSSTTGVQPGDADGDRDADGFDFLVWQRNLGATAPPSVAAGSASSVANELAALLAPDSLSETTASDEAFARLGGISLPTASARSEGAYRVPLRRELVSFVPARDDNNGSDASNVDAPTTRARTHGLVSVVAAATESSADDQTTLADAALGDELAKCSLAAN